MPTRRRLWLWRAALLCLGLISGLVVAELAVRLKLVRPSRQIVRNRGLRTIDGTVVWEEDVSRLNADCPTAHPDWKKVVFFGNSITYGAGVPADETFTAVLQQQLGVDGGSPRVCVMNFAQPGFHFEQQQALATEVIPHYSPDVAVLQDGPYGAHAPNMPRGVPTFWSCTPWKYGLVGGSAYELSNLQLRPDGYPGIAGVPDPVNRALFEHSRLYQYITLSIGEPERYIPPVDYMTCRGGELEKFVDLARSHHTRPLIFLAADMSYPLSDMTGYEQDLQQPLIEYGRQHGFPLVQARRLLSDQDHTAIRMDDWHFNPSGHRILAERLAPIVRQMLNGQDPPLPAPAGR